MMETNTGIALLKGVSHQQVINPVPIINKEHIQVKQQANQKKSRDISIKTLLIPNLSSKSPQLINEANPIVYNLTDDPKKLSSPHHTFNYLQAQSNHSTSNNHLIGTTVGPLLRLSQPQSTPQWAPPHLPIDLNPMHPFGQLVISLQTDLIQLYTNGSHTDVILRLSRKPEIHVTVQDLRQLLTHREPIFHDLLTLSLDIITSQCSGKYLEPAFFPQLCQHGWHAVKNWISPQPGPSPDKPSLTENICIPIHINGNQWVAVYQHYTARRVTFYYADDMNHPSTEKTVQHVLESTTSTQFYPPGSEWKNCKTQNISPHSNECGPRTILALAVLASSQTPSDTSLHKYMHGNLAHCSRVWMAMLLLQGQVQLLPHEAQEPPSTHQARMIHSTPKSIINWMPQPTTLQKQRSIKTDSQ